MNPDIHTDCGCRTERDQWVYLLRTCKAAKKLNLSSVDIIVGLTMLIYEQPWPIMKLANETGYTRAAIRKSLVNFKQFGGVERIPEGWVLTECGKQLVRDTSAEITNIGSKKQNSFTNGYLQELENSRVQVDVGSIKTRYLKLPKGITF